MSYGPQAGAERTFEEIGRAMGVTPQNAQQTYTRAMRKLKREYGEGIEVLLEWIRQERAGTTLQQF